MGHVERHIDKSDEMLIYRLLKDWKLFSGTFLIDMTEELYQKISRENLKEGRNEIVLNFDQVIGYGYNRRFEKIESAYARVIVEKTSEKIEIITAYPELTLGKKTGEKFDFSAKGHELITKILNDIGYNANSSLWTLFVFLTKNITYETRFVAKKKNSQIRVYLGDYTLKITEKSLFILCNGKDFYSNQNCSPDYTYISSYLKELAG